MQGKHSPGSSESSGKDGDQHILILTSLRLEERRLVFFYFGLFGFIRLFWGFNKPFD